jgi:hypothetical protein
MLSAFPLPAVVATNLWRRFVILLNDFIYQQLGALVLPLSLGGSHAFEGGNRQFPHIIAPSVVIGARPTRGGTQFPIKMSSSCSPEMMMMKRGKSFTL